jgi:hypothetical protein
MTQSNSSPRFSSPNSSRPRKPLVFIAMMFGTFLLPAYGQQEMDPTWYDPWAPATAQTAHSAQPQAARSQHQEQAKLKPASTTRTAKARAAKSTKQKPS